MTTEVTVALIAVPAAILPSIVAYLAYRQGRRTESKVVSLEVRVDGRLTELLETATSGSFAKGQAKEASDQHARTNGIAALTGPTGDTGPTGPTGPA